MSIRASVVEDSISPAGIRLTTVQLHYPKFIHGELMTHRVFSRNASSSRAVPTERPLAACVEDPVVPIGLGKNRAGMQAGEGLTPEEIAEVERIWAQARDHAVDTARWLADAFGVHKQHVNRLIEPFSHIDVVVTATDWENFFTLRRHPDAQPEMWVLADAIHQAMYDSDADDPMPLLPGQWHLPYVGKPDSDDQARMIEWALDQNCDGLEVAKMCSVARCARVSYLHHDGSEPDVEKDVDLYFRLVGAVPLHASPAEHQATPDELLMPDGLWEHPREHGNFRGWRQLRKQLPAEATRATWHV